MEISPEATLELLQDVCERSPDLLKSAYRWLDRSVIPLDGYCYVLAEAMYHLHPGLYTPYRLAGEDGSHWFLRHNRSNVVVECTMRGGTPVASVGYSSAKRQKGFITPGPSKRCRTLIERAGLTIPTEGGKVAA